MRRVAIAMCVIAIVAPAAAQEATKDAQTHEAAIEARRAGRFDEALDLLEQIAQHGTPDWKGHAIIARAETYENYVKDPRLARDEYARYLREFPEGRRAPMAKKRLAVLDEGLGDSPEDAAAFQRFHEIRTGFSSRPPGETIAMLERLLADRPSFAAAGEAMYWLGSLYQQEGRSDLAEARFRSVIERRDPKLEPQAWKAIGDIMGARRDWDGARAAYAKLRARGDSTLELSANEAIARLDIDMWRWRGWIAAWVFLALWIVGAALSVRVAAGSGGAALRALARPPLEAVFLAPVALLFVVAGLTEHDALGRAIDLIAVGGLAVTWMTGVSAGVVRRRHGRLGARRAIGHALTAALAVLAISWIAVYWQGLVDLLVETWRFGAQH